ncbi:uncharacterized protein LOC119836746 [Zerene cesonia]|uniref:uncharacterized protein LOC119836746 n=1 Tax=Zerene cesonia TaxID=33412 RepID=UPI0018E580C7|nr:uncharacterized protein LOC119836746 [Zerene cesonia]
MATYFIIITLFLSTNAKVMRNNALMTKMVSKFHKEIEPSVEDIKPESILNRMQTLLCKNFQSVPCEMITQDTALRRLIEQSIQQINYKKHKLEKTTSPTTYLTLFPILNDDATPVKHKPRVRKSKTKHNYKSKDTRTVFNRKKMRKFYPHKVKYKDKNANVKKDFGDYSEDKLSMSVEVPDMTLTKRHQHLSYKVEPAEPPVWRIDYMKHGEPSLNMFGFEDRLKDKIIKGPSVPVADVAERNDAHVNKNFVRKDNANLDSDIVE